MNVEPEDADEGLMLAYAAGDASAFTRLYDRHERAVHRFFRRQSIGAEEADDLLQNTWMAVVRNASSYAPEAKFTTWLYTIARSKLVDHWRATRRHMALALDAANDPDDVEDHDASNLLERIAAGESVRPDVQAMSREYANAFLAAVEALPIAQREAFLLHVEGGVSLEAIAAITSVGIETAKSRVRYAMKRLRAACAVWLQPHVSNIQAAGDET
ncbi:MAG: sigma-70 family RNA polymerase sigma factor [Burkholderiaceae bacterium]